MCCVQPVSLSLSLSLSSLFVLGQSWTSLLVLLEESPKAVVGLGSQLCQPMSAIATHHPALSDRVVAILEMMSEESLYGMTSEVYIALHVWWILCLILSGSAGMECNSNTVCTAKYF